MTKQEKVEFVINTLNELYPEIPIPLDHKDPYTLLIAVLLSAQSTDVRVNLITPILFNVAEDMCCIHKGYLGISGWSLCSINFK